MDSRMSFWVHPGLPGTEKTPWALEFNVPVAIKAAKKVLRNMCLGFIIAALTGVGLQGLQWQRFLVNTNMAACCPVLSWYAHV